MLIKFIATAAKLIFTTTVWCSLVSPTCAQDVEPPLALVPDEDARIIIVASVVDDYVLPPDEKDRPRQLEIHVYPAEDGPDTEAVAAAAAEAKYRNKVVSREIVFQLLNAVDTVQTLSCLDRGVCHEANPVFGRNPSATKLIGLKALGGGLHALVTHLLAKYLPKEVGAFQLASIGLQSGVVAWNLQYSF